MENSGKFCKLLCKEQKLDIFEKEGPILVNLREPKFPECFYWIWKTILLSSTLSDIHRDFRDGATAVSGGVASDRCESASGKIESKA